VKFPTAANMQLFDPNMLDFGKSQAVVVPAAVEQVYPAGQGKL